MAERRNRPETLSAAELKFVICPRAFHARNGRPLSPKRAAVAFFTFPIGKRSGCKDGLLTTP